MLTTHDLSLQCLCPHAIVWSSLWADLVVHQHLGVAPLLEAGILEEGAEAGEGHIVAVEVGRNLMVHVAHRVLMTALTKTRIGQQQNLLGVVSLSCGSSLS